VLKAAVKYRAVNKREDARTESAGSIKCTMSANNSHAKLRNIGCF